MWSLHSDVLKMAHTEEKRERIKWIHARHVFFGLGHFAVGLELAKQCSHDDAHLLVSFFPGGPPPKLLDLATVLMASNDPRCWCWAAACGGGEKVTVTDLLMRSATSGYGWAQSQLITSKLIRVGGEEWLEKAIAQGEPEAMVELANRLCSAGGTAASARPREYCLWREAAELGCAEAQFRLAEHFCATMSLEQFVWLCRAAIQEHAGAVRKLSWSAMKLVKDYDVSRIATAGPLLCEVGTMLALLRDSWEHSVSLSDAACERTLELYNGWCANAKRAVFCWLCLSRQLGVSKDVRLLVADLVWQERSAWSEIAPYVQPSEEKSYCSVR